MSSEQTKHGPVPWCEVIVMDSADPVALDADGAVVFATNHYLRKSQTTPSTPERRRANFDMILRSVNAMPGLLKSCEEMRAFIGVMCGRGPESAIPETIDTPLGVPVKIRAITQAADAAILKATGANP